eukprot:TRINITY_DN42095_c0_g1_i1.p1 TRINITY_DN42095_c0_g1~~TRINITY_DN42095_c0_g1_i1.p1  ORF type:complete len:622 (-),score=0.38 TRINITY_DN42095_c0_g1_i1:79-1944(-)
MALLRGSLSGRSLFHSGFRRFATSSKRDLGEFDYVIVGAGSAGCVLANRLSADPKVSVAVVEAGGNDKYHWIHIPVGYVYAMRYPQHRTNWGYKTCEQPGLNGRSIFYPRGKTLGGSGSINGMIAQRGQQEDYDGWAELLQDESWSWAKHRANFERLINYKAGPSIMPDGSVLGTDGPLEINRQALQWPILDQWADACEKAGIPRRTHFIDSQTEGVGYFEVTQRGGPTTPDGVGGIRLSPFRAFLAPVLDRPNLKVFTNTHAKNILFDKDEATGQVSAAGLEVWSQAPNDSMREYIRALLVDAKLLKSRKDPVVDRQVDELCGIKARKEIILTTGAVGSPHLLQCSGIGDDNLLRTNHVDTVVDLPGVGANLHDHLQIRAVFRLDEKVKTLNSIANSWVGSAKMALEYVTSQSGPMAMAPSQLGVFARSSAAVKTPDLQWHVQPLSLDSWEEPLHPWPGLTASVCNLRPSSRGSLELTSPDTRDPPRIDPAYLQTEQDRTVAAASMELTRRIAAQLEPGLVKGEHVPGEGFCTPEELAKRAGDIGTSIFHPAGTTKMGPDGDPGAVLNSKLQVRDGTKSGIITGLRVADCGVMPNIVSGNTNIPTYAIAEKCARMILGQE